MTTNVFIVDDSATARTALRLILETSDDINVLGVASNPLIALKRMAKEWPDVIISDLEMPEMHGFEFLKYIKRNKPTPFIVFSNYTGTSAMSSVEALSQGALDIIPKPNFNCSDSLEETSINILNAVRAAAKIEVPYRDIPDIDTSVAASNVAPEASQSAIEQVSDTNKVTAAREAVKLDQELELGREKYSILALGSSTGGTVIIEKILRQLRSDAPGVVIVQHMPEHFTKAFANRISQFCQIDVREAEDGDSVSQGVALIAPGGKHMKITGRPPHYRVSVFDGEYVNRHRPSVDVLFNSVAEVARKDALGIILTGMGKDGAKGLLAMKNAGAETIAQAQQDCAVYGMPKAAKAIHAVDHDMDSSKIAYELSFLTQR